MTHSWRLYFHLCRAGGTQRGAGIRRSPTPTILAALHLLHSALLVCLLRTSKKNLIFEWIYSFLMSYIFSLRPPTSAPLRLSFYVQSRLSALWTCAVAYRYASVYICKLVRNSYKQAFHFQSSISNCLCLFYRRRCATTALNAGPTRR